MLNEPIGEVLAQSRTNLGKSIKEVEFDTKIRAKHIEALEADDFDTLPGSIYTQGFIKTYANYLGIDPEPLIKSYRNRYLQPSDGDLLNVSSNIRVETKKSPAWLPYAIVAGLAVVLFLGLIAWGGYTKNKSKEQKLVVQSIKGKQTFGTVVAGATASTIAKNASDTNNDDSSDSDSSTTSTTDEKKDNKSTDTTETDGKNKDDENKDNAQKDGKTSVTVKLTGIDGEGSWVKVYVDGEPEFVGVIDSGKSKLFEGDTDVRVRIGNENGMEVMLNGKKISTKKLDVSKGVIDHTFKDNDVNNEGNDKGN